MKMYTNAFQKYIAGKKSQKLFLIVFCVTDYIFHLHLFKQGCARVNINPISLTLAQA